MAGNFLLNLKDKSLDGIAGISSTIEQKSQTRKLEMERDNIYREMGVQCYQLFQINALPISQFEAFCARLRDVEVQLKTLQNPVLNQNAGFGQSTKQCSCGSSVSLDAKFCPSCGFNFIETQFAAQSAIQNAPQQICVCGSLIQQGQTICMQCGRQTITENLPAATTAVGLTPTCACGAAIQAGQLICLQCGKLI